jgi:5-methylcytosine-specific restriction protein A
LSTEYFLDDTLTVLRTFILTWNPDKWPTNPKERLDWEARWDSAVNDTSAGIPFYEPWSTGVRNSGIRPGDRAFLLRQHRDRGIVASGTFTSDAYIKQHWDDSGSLANYADIEWDTVLPIPERLSIEELQAAIPSVSWDRMQASGVRVRAENDQAILSDLWEAHFHRLGLSALSMPEEVAFSDTFVEGAVSRVVVNRFERDPKARQACLDHWGYDCAVCASNLADFYGELGRDFIHVHHLRELSSLGGSYCVDPVKDLRPVCPNCHSMLHRSRPALTVSQLRARMKAAQR